MISCVSVTPSVGAVHLFHVADRSKAGAGSVTFHMPHLLLTFGTGHNSHPDVLPSVYFWPRTGTVTNFIIHFTLQFSSSSSSLSLAPSGAQTTYNSSPDIPILGQPLKVSSSSSSSSSSLSLAPTGAQTTYNSSPGIPILGQPLKVSSSSSSSLSLAPTGAQTTYNSSPDIPILVQPLKVSPGATHPLCFSLQITVPAVSWAASLSLSFSLARYCWWYTLWHSSQLLELTWSTQLWSWKAHWKTCWLFCPKYTANQTSFLTNVSQNGMTYSKSVDLAKLKNVALWYLVIQAYKLP